MSILTNKISEFKGQIYDWEIDLYKWSLANLYFSFCLFSSGMSLLAIYFVNTWYFSLFTNIIFVIELIYFLIISKKYSEYSLVYSEYGKGERLLFTENF